MSDDQMPAWAKAMEKRLLTRADADMLKHRLVLEVSKAINDGEARLGQRIADLRTEMTRRFDQGHDDLTINLARADVAIERVQRLEGDVHKELPQLQRRPRELENWRDHRPEAGT